MLPKSKLDDLPDADFTIFFRVLRYVSAQAPSRGGGKTSSLPVTSPPSLGTSPQTSALMVSPGGTTGESSSAMNRIAIPEGVSRSLEMYRMAFTNLPIEQDALTAAREQLITAMEQQYSTDVDTVKKLFAPDSDDMNAASSLTSVKANQNRSNLDGMQSMQEIIPGLWCGSYHPAANKELLKKNGITHICCCIGTASRFPSDFMYFTIPADDRQDYNISQFFSRTFEFIENALIKERGAVLVHCGAGISRAPTITAAYIIRKLRLSPSAAIRLIQSKRPFASPNMGFRQQLQEYATRLKIPEENALEVARIAKAGSKMAMEAISQAGSF